MSIPTIHPHRLPVAVPCGCILGEAPIWDGRRDTLYFVDIKSRVVFAWRPGTGGEPARHPMPAQVGFVQLTPDPDWIVVGLQTGVALYDLAAGAVVPWVSPEPDRPGNRLNDAGVGPDGSLYFGSMDDAEIEPTGSFYHVTQAGLSRFGEHATVTNGPTVDAERRILYTADTQGGRVFRHRLSADGTPGEPDPFITLGQGQGHPDGVTLDAEGHVWIAHFGGSRLTRFSPDGVAVLEVPVPTAKVTKVGFGGPDLSTLYVTTAAIGQDRETDLLAGHLFTADLGIRGLPAPICTLAPIPGRPADAPPASGAR